MYWTAVRKELLLNILSLRYSLVFLLFVGLTISATAVRTAIHQRQVVQHQEAERDMYEAMVSVHRFWQSRGLGIAVERTPNPLAIFATGLENEMTRSYSISEWALPRAGERKLPNPAFRYALNPDMVLVVNFVCSLLAVLLIFDAVSGERERGTLKVLLAGPLPRDVVIVSKIASGLFTLLVPLALSWALSIVWVVVIQGISLDLDQYARLAWLIGLSAIYIVFFFALGMAISCWTRRSATALAAGLFCWVILVLAAPNLIPLVVNHFAPIPPESKVTLQRDAFEEKWRTEIQNKIYAELSASGKYDSDENALWQELMRRRNEEERKEVEKIEKFHNSRVGRQLRLNQDMSRLSPSASYTYSSTNLAGTGLRDFLLLLDDVDGYQKAFMQAQEEQEQQRREKGNSNQWWRFERDAYDPARYPPFQPRSVAMADVLRGAGLDILFLVGGTVVLLLVSVIGFMRYDPR